MAKLQKEELFGMLDRAIGFIRNCDNKVSISLAFYSIIFTVLLANNSIISIKNTISMLIDKHCILGTIFVILLICSISVLIVGICKMFRVLLPFKDKYKESELDTNSKIFFEHVAKRTYKQYKEQLLSSSDDEFINDLISQIYINSKIADEKYKYYKSGLIISIIGFAAFIVLWSIGSIPY